MRTERHVARAEMKGLFVPPSVREPTAIIGPFSTSMSFVSFRTKSLIAKKFYCLYSTREMRFADATVRPSRATPRACSAIGSRFTTPSARVAFFRDDPRVKTGRFGVLSGATL